MGYRVVVVGATGNVGREMLNILAERQFPVDEIAALDWLEQFSLTLPTSGSSRSMMNLRIGHLPRTGQKGRRPPARCYTIEAERSPNGVAAIDQDAAPHHVLRLPGKRRSCNV